MSLPAAPASRRKHAVWAQRRIGRLGLVEDLPASQRRERNLGGRDRPESVALDRVHLVADLGRWPVDIIVVGQGEGRRSDLLVGVRVAVERERARARGSAGTPRPGRAGTSSRRSCAPASRSRMPERRADLPVRHALVLGEVGNGLTLVHARPPAAHLHVVVLVDARRGPGDQGGSGSTGAGRAGTLRRASVASRRDAFSLAERATLTRSASLGGLGVLVASGLADLARELLHLGAQRSVVLEQPAVLDVEGDDLVDRRRDETPRRPRAAFTTSGSRRSWTRSIMRQAYRARVERLS